MTDGTRRAFAAFGIVVLILAMGALLGVQCARVRALSGAEAVALEVTPVPDSVKHWWADAARCLGADTTWGNVRVFVGHGTVPAGWRAADDQGYSFGGYSSPSLNAIWVRELTAPLVTHEAYHLRYAPWRHPPDIFGADGQHPRCGLAPA